MCSLMGLEMGTESTVGTFLDNVEQLEQGGWIKAMLQEVRTENEACPSWHEAPSHCLADTFCQGSGKG